MKGYWVLSLILATAAAYSATPDRASGTANDGGA